MEHHFERYCKDIENVENYGKALADNFVGWVCHHRKGVNISIEKLIALGMYYNRPAEELIFMTDVEHGELHNKGKHIKENNPFYGKRHSEESKKKMSESHKGKPGPNKGKHLTKETKCKIGENSKGRHWYNNGVENKFCYECPDGFVKGMLKK